MNRNPRESRKEQVYRMLGTSAYTQQDVAEVLKVSKTTISKYVKELVENKRLVQIAPFPHDSAQTKRYSSIKMTDIDSSSSIGMDGDYLIEEFLDFVRKHFPSGLYDNERELTMRMERLVRAIVNFPQFPTEDERLEAAEKVKEYTSDVISDVTNLLMLLKAFAAIDLRSRAIHPILKSSEAKEAARIIGERVDSGIAHQSQEEQE